MRHPMYGCSMYSQALFSPENPGRKQAWGELGLRKKANHEKWEAPKPEGSMLGKHVGALHENGAKARESPHDPGRMEL